MHVESCVVAWFMHDVSPVCLRACGSQTLRGLIGYELGWRIFDWVLVRAGKTGPVSSITYRTVDTIWPSRGRPRFHTY